MKRPSIQWLILTAALVLSACASKPPRADYPTDANSAREIAHLEMKIQKAKAQQHDLLAPREFDRAEHYLGEARSARSRDTDMGETWKNLSYARGYYRLAEKRVKERAPNAQDVLNARAGALNNGVKKTTEAAAALQRADEKFRDRAKRLERRDDEFWSELRNEYAGIEIAAVQENKLGAVRQLMDEARSNGASKYAPKTLKEAEAVVAEAETAIARSPRREEAYAEKVAQAGQAARWLIAVNATARQMSKEPPEKIAREIVERNERLADMKAEAGGLETQAELNRRALASTAEQLSAVERDLATERQLNQAIADIRKRFNENEAEIYRQGDQLLIQLKDIGFRPGSAQLPEQKKPLLSKVKAALTELHPQELVIQGHADATGSRKVNQKISAKRAETVANYLEDVAEGVETEGMADARPIRSNKTPTGRAANRRVDIIVTPQVQ